jgi:hypothetical protein
MKFRSVFLRTASFLLTLGGVFITHLAAQDQPASEVPLQIQENEAPAPSPAEGQGAAIPTPGEPPAPAADSGMGSTGQNPPASDPNSLIPPPAEPEQPSPINAAGNEEKQRQEQKERYYAVKVKADKEDDLASLIARSEKAGSDESKRQALRSYYDLLAKRMKKLDPSLSEWIDTMHAAYLRRLAQVRVEPTIPVNPPPAPDQAAATPKKKAKVSDANADQTEAKPTPSPVAKKKKVQQ